MRHLLLTITFLGSMAAALALEACDEGELNCKQLCDSAQEQDCTYITGDCGEVCASLTNVQDESGCKDEREAYADCLNGEGVCSGSCDDRESDLTGCLTVYCATRLTEPDCMTIADALD